MDKHSLKFSSANGYFRISRFNLFNSSVSNIEIQENNEQTNVRYKWWLFEFIDYERSNYNNNDKKKIVKKKQQQQYN